MKYLPILIILSTPLACLADSPKVYVYGSNGDFHHLELTHGSSFRHINNSDEFTLELPDGKLIPISELDSCVVRTVDVPHIYIDLPDYPDSTMIWSKTDYITANVSISGNNYITDLQPTKAQIRGRGNSSWSFDKKPMRIKFDKKTQIDGLSKAKNYVLLNNMPDPTMLKNNIMMWLSNRLGMKYANHGINCNVSINGSPIGNYLLTEKVGINSGSVDIDESNGILFELSTEFDEPYKFRSALYNLPVMVKEPDFDELAADGVDNGMTGEERLKLWEADFNEAESSVVIGNPWEYIDVESAAKFVFIFNILSNDEIGWPKSFYIYKEALGKDHKYFMGPCWDFDVCAGHLRIDDNGNYVESKPTFGIWLNDWLVDLVKYPEFRNSYSKILESFNDEIFDELMDYIDSQAILIEPSAKINGTIWPDIDKPGFIYCMSTFDHATHISNLKSWLKRRQEFITTNFLNGEI